MRTKYSKFPLAEFWVYVMQYTDGFTVALYDQKRDAKCFWDDRDVSEICAAAGETLEEAMDGLDENINELCQNLLSASLRIKEKNYA